MEKEVIRRRVRKAWKELSERTVEDERTKILREVWKELDNLWCELYDEEY